MTDARMRKHLKASRDLVGSPVRQKPEKSKAFLRALHGLERERITADHIFADDNEDEGFGQTLSQLLPEDPKAVILPGKAEQGYLWDEESHHWNDALMHKAAGSRNAMIAYALANQYDYLLLADPDLALHPQPNVWRYDGYGLPPRTLGEQRCEPEAAARRDGLLARLRTPGTYEAGAHTLIWRSALQGGVSFAPIHDPAIHREDRSFCIRGAVRLCRPPWRGIPLHILQNPAAIADGAAKHARCGTRQQYGTILDTGPYPVSRWER